MLFFSGDELLLRLTLTPQQSSSELARFAIDLER